nr:Chain C, Polypeptide chain [synthetic construct]2Q6G_D Chain D, Polypeptide chain [synthetic construct]4ZUH_C Chain C, peptide substrate SAVLQSGF [synthetic construct]
TSAVLQSGFRK